METKDGEKDVDYVNHPKHYNTGKIEVIEFLEDQRLGFSLGNTVKYICRAGRKDKNYELQDLEKAAWYLQRHIEVVRAQVEGREPLRPNNMPKKDSQHAILLERAKNMVTELRSVNSAPQHPDCPKGVRGVYDEDWARIGELTVKLLEVTQ